MSVQSPKTRIMLLLQPIKKTPRLTNIFSQCQRSEDFSSPTSPYHVVGDRSFKHKFSRDKSLSFYETVDTSQPTQRPNCLNSTFCQFRSSVNNGTLVTKLSKSKQLEISRNRRTFMQLEKVKHRDQQIDNHIRKRMSYFGTRQVKDTITFSKQQIQTDPNPELIDLINDNIPEYWKNSLRDNEKRLKRHIKGNTFRREVAEEMLQTLRGREKLIDSIPKIKDEYLQPICSRNKMSPKKKKKISVKGLCAIKWYQGNPDEGGAPAPQIQFDEVYKIHYNSGYRWMGSQLC